MHAELYMRMCTCTCEGTLVCSKGKLHAQAGRSTVLNRCRFVLFEFGQPQLSSGSLLVDFFEFFGEAWHFYLLEPECKPRLRVTHARTTPCHALHEALQSTPALPPCHTPHHSLAIPAPLKNALRTLSYGPIHRPHMHA